MIATFKNKGWMKLMDQLCLSNKLGVALHLQRNNTRMLFLTNLSIEIASKLTGALVWPYEPAVHGVKLLIPCTLKAKTSCRRKQLENQESWLGVGSC